MARICVLSYPNKVSVSDDCAGWLSSTIPAPWATNKECRAVAWGGGRYVALQYGSNIGAYSSDGLNWTVVTLPLGARNWVDCAYNEQLGLFIALSGLDYLTSPDGITWTARQFTSAMWAVSCTPDGLTVVGGATQYLRSVDCINWVAVTPTTPLGGTLYKIAWNGSIFLAIAHNTWYWLTSPDGVTWTRRSNMSWYTTWAGLSVGGGYSAGMFVAMDTTGRIAFTPDGAGWTVGSNAAASQNQSLVWNGIYVYSPHKYTGGGLYARDGTYSWVSDNTLPALNGFPIAVVGASFPVAIQPIPNVGSSVQTLPAVQLLAEAITGNSSSAPLGWAVEGTLEYEGIFSSQPLSAAVDAIAITGSIGSSTQSLPAPSVAGTLSTGRMGTSTATLEFTNTASAWGGQFVRNLTELVYVGVVQRSVQCGYALMGYIASSFVLAAPLRDMVVSSHEAAHDLGPIIVGGVVGSCEYRADLDAVTKVYKLLNVVSVFQPAVTSVDSQLGRNPHLVVGGRTVDILSCSLQQSEGSVHWSAEVELADFADYQSLDMLDALTLVFGDDSYSLIVLSKHMQRQDGSMRIGISLISPSVLFDNPYSLLGVDTAMTWGAATSAKAIVDGLLTGITVQWSIVDWTLPPELFSVSNESALSASRKLVAAVGGVLLANKDGSLTAQYRYPTPVADYSVAVVDSFLTFGTFEDVYTLTEAVKETKKYNLIRIMDSTPTDGTGGSDRIELGETPYELRVFPHPWRTGFTLNHTAPNCTITGGAITPFTMVDELVEFKNGVSSLRYPIDSIISVEWVSVSLGSLSFSDYETEVRTAGTGYGLANVTYNTRFMLYNVDTPLEAVQFLMQESLP